MGTQALWLAIVALLGTGGCSLLLDFDQTITDAGPTGVDAFAIDPAAVEACEPNDDFESAEQIIGGDRSPLAISPSSDQDFYSFELEQPSNVIIDVFADQDSDDFDLGMRLYSSSDQLLIVDDGVIDDRITRRNADALNSGRYYVEVYAASGQANAYSLRLQISTATSAP